MTIIKVSELTGPALDWAVAKCETPSGRDSADGWLRDYKIGFGTWYSTNWSQGGPIIEMEQISIECLHDKLDIWYAWTPAPEHPKGEASGLGKTPLIAAMRAFVASKLGDEVEIPEELL